MVSARRPDRGVPSPIRVTWDGAPQRTLEFTRSFQIGRVPECDVCIQSDFVSRVHVSVYWENGKWWVKDLQSSNGLFAGDQKITASPVNGTLTVRLGIRGPSVTLQAPEPSVQSSPSGSDRRITSLNRYFGKIAEGEQIGEHTILVRRAFTEIQKRQRWRYRWIMAAFALVLIGAGAYAFHLRRELSQNKASAERLFYSMKALDFDIANIEKRLEDSGSKASSSEIARLQQSRLETEISYDRFLTTLKVYDPKMTEAQRLILRVARIFGECELAMPPAFANEVQNYIQKWQSSNRLANAIALANEKGYTSLISREFLGHDLPPQFFYLALKESGFDPYISGPMTRKGYAKGMWQFIPETAAKYGLKIGPLVDLPRADTNDDRNHYDRATTAAATYIKDLYRTDAQASGLLVMACYNWGENRVLPLVQSMPANPRERNFWQLLSKYRERIPPETYDYVFYIVSAAVIGENPRLFGFRFDDPLRDSVSSSGARGRG